MLGGIQRIRALLRGSTVSPYQIERHASHGPITFGGIIGVLEYRHFGEIIWQSFHDCHSFFELISRAFTLQDGALGNVMIAIGVIISLSRQCISTAIKSFFTHSGGDNDPPTGAVPAQRD